MSGEIFFPASVFYPEHSLINVIIAFHEISGQHTILDTEGVNPFRLVLLCCGSWEFTSLEQHFFRQVGKKDVSRLPDWVETFGAKERIVVKAN